MFDPGFNQLLDQIAAARREGKSMPQMLQMAHDFLAAQSKEYAESRRDELLKQVEQLAAFSPNIEAIANAKDEKQGMAAVLGLFAAVQAAEPREHRDARQAEALARLQQAQEEYKERQAAHRKERVARGLSEVAGTGEPEPAIELVAVPEEELPYEDKPRRNLSTMISAIEAAKRKRDRAVLKRLPPGASRFGGVPDLPRSVEWPLHQGKKLPFLAQIDLSALPKSKNKALPPGGWLYAFGLFSNDKAHWPPPVVVTTYRGERSSLARAARPAEEEIWPDWGGARVYETVPLKVRRGRPGAEPSDDRAGWLFGEMDGVFGTPGEMADAAFKDGDDWINLLAILSVGSMQWSDCGHLYLLIRRGELMKGQFSGVMGVICSS